MGGPRVLPDDRTEMRRLRGDGLTVDQIWGKFGQYGRATVAKHVSDVPCVLKHRQSRERQILAAASRCEDYALLAYRFGFSNRYVMASVVCRLRRKAREALNA